MDKKLANFNQIARLYDNEPVSANQLKFIRDLMEKKGITVNDIITDGFPPLEKLTKAVAPELLGYLQKYNEDTLPSRSTIDLTGCHCACHEWNNEMKAKILKNRKDCILCGCEIKML